MSAILAGYVILSWLGPGDFLESAFLSWDGWNQALHGTNQGHFNSKDGQSIYNYMAILNNIFI
jgi:hypothetical protein